MARTAGQALFTGSCAAFAFTCFVFAFLAWAISGGSVALGLALLGVLAAFAAWACDTTRDRTSVDGLERLNRD